MNLLAKKKQKYFKNKIKLKKRRNRDTDIENKHMDTNEGKEKVG